MDTPHTITTLTRNGQPPAPVTGITHPPMPVHELPPGVELVTLPGGHRTLAYTHHATSPGPVAHPAQPIPAWAKTTALLAPTVGGGVGAAGIGLSYAAPGLIAMSHALWSAAALIATSTLAVAALLWAARQRTTGPEPAQVTQNITATGMFGRASGTIHNR